MHKYAKEATTGTVYTNIKPVLALTWTAESTTLRVFPDSTRTPYYEGTDKLFVHGTTLVYAHQNRKTMQVYMLANLLRHSFHNLITVQVSCLFYCKGTEEIKLDGFTEDRSGVQCENHGRTNMYKYTVKTKN